VLRISNFPPTTRRQGERLIRVVISFTIPNRLEFFLAGPVLLYRRLRYGYAFRKITLTKGKYAKVDPDDYYRLSEYKWRISKDYGKFYAIRTGRKQDGKGRKVIRMHREVAKTPDGLECDHINGDSLDNRKANLRSATRLQNSWNRSKSSKPGYSKYKGVTFDKKMQKWFAQIRVRGKHISLGRFEDEIEAAKAYDKAAKKHFGDFANLNFKE
jgi:hypothetical protein